MKTTDELMEMTESNDPAIRKEAMLNLIARSPIELGELRIRFRLTAQEVAIIEQHQRLEPLERLTSTQ